MVWLVPWFPRKIKELDRSVANILDAGTDLESDHPGFSVRGASTTGTSNFRLTRCCSV
jgi:hypothetical protein